MVSLKENFFRMFTEILKMLQETYDEEAREVLRLVSAYQIRQTVIQMKMMQNLGGHQYCLMMFMLKSTCCSVWKLLVDHP